MAKQLPAPQDNRQWLTLKDASDFLGIHYTTLRLDDAIAKTQGRLPVEPDRQAERTRLAITGLITKGLIAHQEGFVWCK